MVALIFINLVIRMIQVIAMIIDIFTFPIYFVIQKPWRKTCMRRLHWSIQLLCKEDEVTYRSNNKKHFSKIHLCKEMEEKGVDTVEKMFNFVHSKHEDKLCIGTRPILRVNEDISVETGQIVKTYDMGKYTWITYNQLFSRALEFGRGIRELGYDSGTKVVIYASTRGKKRIISQEQLGLLTPITSRIDNCNFYSVIF